jgi:hypothetical protein
MNISVVLWQEHSHILDIHSPQGALVSHQTPLHPDADLAVVLDDMRRRVAAWGDEGMVMRVFRASICLMLLSILDTLIELLADFRAGRLPPVLPALERPSNAAARGAEHHRKTPRLSPEAAARAPSHGAAACDISTPDAENVRATPAAGRPAQAPRAPGSPLSSPRLAIRGPATAPRGIAWCPSHVPRPPIAEFGGRATSRTHTQNVTIPKYYIIRRAGFGAPPQAKNPPRPSPSHACAR